jgi:hypothetical protein
MTKKTINRKRATAKVLTEVPKDPTQRNIPALFPTRKTLRKSLAKTYYPVDKNIYYDGHSFRVRVRTEGKTLSWNTPDKVEAKEYRDYQILARAKRKLKV